MHERLGNCETGAGTGIDNKSRQRIGGIRWKVTANVTAYSVRLPPTKTPHFGGAVSAYCTLVAVTRLPV